MTWYEQLPAGTSWSSLWHHIALCSCGAIRTDPVCSVCGVQPVYECIEVVDKNGVKHLVPATIETGAEGRFEDWLYLDLIQREWMRPTSLQPDGLLRHHHISERAGVVLLFWTYFEGRIERLVRLGMKGMTEALREDLLARYFSIGSRMDKLYKLLFATTYHSDLRAVGAEPIAELIREVQVKRNKFSHGHPSAISDELVARLVASLKDEHYAWITVFNRRIAKQRN